MNAILKTIKIKSILGKMNRILNNKSSLIFISIFSGILCGLMYRQGIIFNKFINVEELYNIGGKLFISVLQMVATPLVFFSISKGMLLNKKSSWFFITIFSIFLIFTFISILIGLGVIFSIKPWNAFEGASVQMSSFQVSQALIDKSGMSFSSILKNIVPTNFLEPFLTGNILQAIFLAIILSISSKLSGAEESFLNFVSKADDIMISLGSMVVRLSPIPVFSFSFWMVATQELKLIHSLGLMVVSVYVSCIIVLYVFYPAVLLMFGLNPLKILKHMIPLQIFAYIIDSSASVMPENLKLSKKLGVDTKISEVVIPLGSTLNMNGSAIYIVLSVIFLSKISNIDLTYGHLLLLIMFGTLCAIGTAPIPGSATIFVISINNIFGVPPESIGVILAIDRILDMIRTSVNISGDLIVSLVISKFTKTLNMKAYKKI